MPREEVPYPCDCGECNTSQKLKTINGIEPNDGGNISILGDEGVTVKTDKDNHIVTFGIDTSTIDNVKHANSADTATNATNADYATRAGSATSAASAQTAGIADKATTADSATKATYDANGKTIMNTDGTQNVTGAKTFVGDQVFTGAISASGAITATGAINASNTANVIKAANHDSVLTSNDVLTAKDINEVNGKGNNLLHRSGDEATTGSLQARKLTVSDSNPWLVMIDKGITRGTTPTSWRRSQMRITDDSGNLLIGRVTLESNTDKSRALDLEAYENDGNYYAILQMTCTASGTAELRFCLMDNNASKIIKSTVIATLSK